jgi:hypothetical protein
MEDKNKLQWYYRGWAIALAILCFGPLGLILLWFRPGLNKWVKIWISAAVIAFTILYIQQSIEFYKRIMEYYQMLAEELQK